MCVLEDTVRPELDIPLHLLESSDWNDGRCSYPVRCMREARVVVVDNDSADETSPASERFRGYWPVGKRSSFKEN